MTNCFGPIWLPDYFTLRSPDVPLCGSVSFIEWRAISDFIPAKVFFCLYLNTVGKLMELHGEGGAGGAAKASGDDTGAKVERADGYEPPIQETV